MELTREATAGHRRHGPHRRRLASATCASRRSARKTADQAQAQIAELTKGGAPQLIVDVRRTSGGSLDGGLALARLFVGSGTLAMRETKGSAKETIAARRATAASTLPTTVLVDTGTSGAAELFASALLGQQARGTDWRAHHRPRRAAEADQAAGRQRPLAHDDPLPHA